MESKAGSILLLISGILAFAGALVFILIAIVSLALPVPVTDGGQLWVVFMFVLFIWFLAAGLLKLWASSLMKNSKTTTKGGIIAVIVGVLSGFGILAIIGGIIGIVQGEQK